MKSYNIYKDKVIQVNKKCVIAFDLKYYFIIRTLILMLITILLFETHDLDKF